MNAFFKYRAPTQLFRYVYISRNVESGVLGVFMEPQ